MGNKRRYLLYPILFGIYPVFNLIAQNIVEIQLIDVFRTLIASLIFSLLLYFLLHKLFKDQHIAAIFTTLLLIIFFFYGHFYFYFSNNQLFGLDLSRIRYLIPLNFIILAIGSWLIWKFKNSVKNLTPSLFVISIVLLLFPISQISQYYWSQSRNSLTPNSIELASLDDQLLPDIYYIILDGYSRGDVLENYFDFDNSEFLQNLEDEDFYIAQCSQANYSWTLPSLSSTLNMIYLNVESESIEIAYSENEMYALIKNNQVRNILEIFGYEIIAFENGFNWLHWYDADYYLSSIGDEESFLRLTLGLNSFELLMLETTALRILLDINLIENPNQAINFSDIVSNPREIHRQRINFILDNLPEISSISREPKFIYAHIVSPHDPYIYGPNGEILPEDPLNIEQAYIDKLNYINGQIFQVVQQIKNNTDGEAIIIIQGDHGAPIEWSESEQNAKLGILNAIYLPGLDGTKMWHQSISPVNTFRMIFNQYFGQNFEILPDLSIFGQSSPSVELPCEN